jgi:hypothetical protein
MARILLQGSRHTAEITFSEDEEAGIVVVTCFGVQSDGWPDITCSWTERYDDLRDATEYAADHVDGRW